MAKEISSTFAHNAQGWTVIGDPGSSGWEATGGDPKGYLAWVDSASGEDSYFQAPKNYLGNKHAYYGGKLTYSILDTGNGYTAYDVKIVGSGTTLEYTSPNDTGFPTPGVWSNASVDLIASNFIDVATGLAATVAEMKLVLKDITELDIRAEYVNGGESGGLDNVHLIPPSSTLSDATIGDHPSGFSLLHHIIA